MTWVFKHHSDTEIMLVIAVNEIPLNAHSLNSLYLSASCVAALNSRTVLFQNITLSVSVN